MMLNALNKASKELAHHRNAYVLAFAATTGCICFGWDIGLIGGVLALPSFKQYFDIERASPAAQAALNGNIVSILQAGGLFGAIISIWLASRFGRKRPMIVAAVIYIIGSVIQSIVGLGGGTPAVGLKLLYFGRFVGGVGLGITVAIAPSYLSECAPRTIRGRLTGCIELSVGVGNLLGFWVNYGVAVQIPISEIQWRLPIILQIIPGVLLFISMFFQPESPRWLVEMERYEDAAKSLAYISRTDPSSPAVQTTLAEIRADFVGRHKLSLVSQLRKMGESRTIAYRCFVGPFLTFLQQWSGTNAINYYAPQIFASLGISGTSASLFATGIYGVVKFVFTIVVLAFIIDSWGRKSALFYGGLGQAVAMLWIGIYAATAAATVVGSEGNPTGTILSKPVAPATYATLVAVYLYGVAFCLGWGFTPLLLGAELAPSHVRPAVMALATAMTWLWTYVIAQATPRMLATIAWGTYVVFGVASVVMAVYAWAGVPETTGVPLEDVKWLFESTSSSSSSWTEVWVRFVQDAPGGRVFLGKKRCARVPRIEELKKQAREERRGGGEKVEEGGVVEMVVERSDGTGAGGGAEDKEKRLVGAVPVSGSREAVATTTADDALII